MSPRVRRPAPAPADHLEDDISHRVLLDRLTAELKSMAETFSLRFTHLDDGHARLERRLDAVDDKLDETRETVAHLIGERRGERRAGGRGAPPSAPVESRSRLRRLSLAGAVAIGIITVLGGLSSAYSTGARLLTAIIQAIGGS